MTSIEFVELEDVYLIHRRSLQEYGGPEGIRDQNGLESAVFAAENTHHYAENPEGLEHVSLLAATYWFHISSNHPFVDGNKRTAFAVAQYFLALNGLKIDRNQVEVYETAIEVASGLMGKEELAALICKNLVLLDI